jgi:RNA polymerase sigma factor (sigma-70 family)
LVISNEVSIRVHDAIKRYSSSIIQIAYSYTKNLPDAEDIAQDVFLALLTKNPLLTSDEHEKAWLIRVAINKCKDCLKSPEKRLHSPLTERLGYTPQEPNDLRQMVMALDVRFRIPLHLFYFERYSIKEIAAMMRKRPSTVNTWLIRGRNQLKEILGVPENERK